tara:strand:+ start:3126 stop:3239 length:114 start_codon:yes stop_codon:yes gene_type:complete
VRSGAEGGVVVAVDMAPVVHEGVVFPRGGGFAYLTRG